MFKKIYKNKCYVQLSEFKLKIISESSRMSRTSEHVPRKNEKIEEKNIVFIATSIKKSEDFL
jgi:hypothetical protein